MTGGVAPARRRHRRVGGEQSARPPAGHAELRRPAHHVGLDRSVEHSHRLPPATARRPCTRHHPRSQPPPLSPWTEHAPTRAAPSGGCGCTSPWDCRRSKHKRITMRTAPQRVYATADNAAEAPATCTRAASWLSPCCCPGRSGCRLTCRSCVASVTAACVEIGSPMSEQSHKRNGSAVRCWQANTAFATLTPYFAHSSVSSLSKFVSCSRSARGGRRRGGAGAHAGSAHASEWQGKGGGASRAARRVAKLNLAVSTARAHSRQVTVTDVASNANGATLRVFNRIPILLQNSVRK